jgi:hypothetical protein
LIERTGGVRMQIEKPDREGASGDNRVFDDPQSMGFSR